MDIALLPIPHRVRLHSLEIRFKGLILIASYRSDRGHFPQRQAQAYKRGLPAHSFDSGLIALIGEHMFLD